MDGWIDGGKKSSSLLLCFWKWLENDDDLEEAKKEIDKINVTLKWKIMLFIGVLFSSSSSSWFAWLLIEWKTSRMWLSLQKKPRFPEGTTGIKARLGFFSCCCSSIWVLGLGKKMDKRMA